MNFVLHQDRTMVIFPEKLNEMILIGKELDISLRGRMTRAKNIPADAGNNRRQQGCQQEARITT